MVTTASAPGKVILLGEHAAVYGNPVLVATVDKRVTVTVEKSGKNKIVAPQVGVSELSFSNEEISALQKKRELSLILEAMKVVGQEFDYNEGWEIKIDSEIPVGCGMGSSAALAAALVAGMATALGRYWEKKRIAELAWKIEHVIHGTSSGVDPYAVTFGGVLLYKKGGFQKLTLPEYPDITIGNTGIASDTGEVVADVMKLKEAFPDLFGLYLTAMEKIIAAGKKYLEAGNLEKFGQVMNINHGLLSAIGVSSPKLEKLVWAAREKSLGSKLCGAGRGGIMVALGDVSWEIEKVGGEVIKTKISEDGVRVDD